MCSARLKPAIAFFRKSPRSAVRDSRRSERALIEAFAQRSGYEIVYEFAYKGGTGDEFFDSPAFEAMLARIEAKKAQTVIVARAASLADNPLVLAVGAAKFRQYGVELLSVEPAVASAITISPAQIVDHIFEIGEKFEKHLGRMAERQRIKLGPRRRKNYVEMFPEAVSLVKRLHEKGVRDGVRTSLRQLSAALAEHGHFNNAGNPYHPDEIRRMIKGPDPLHREP